MGKLRNTLAAISILLLASCGGNKDYYMFTSFHEPADEGLRYLYSEDGMQSGQYSRCLAEAGIRTTSPDARPFHGAYTGWYLSFGMDHQLERGFRLWLCKFQRLDSLVGATNDSRNGRRTDHCQCMGSGDFL